MPPPPIDPEIGAGYAHGSGRVTLTWTPPGVEVPACDHALPALVTVVTTLALSIRADIYELDFPFVISNAVSFPVPSVLLRQAHIPPALAIQLANFLMRPLVASQRTELWSLCN